MILEGGPLFIADNHVWADPNPLQITQTAKGAARHVRRFGVKPQIALCSQSQFGNLNSETGKKMRQALNVLDTEKVAFTHEGEMNIDTSLDPDLRTSLLPENHLRGRKCADICQCRCRLWGAQYS